MKPPAYPRRQAFQALRGFTLIEILVVVAILGIALTASALALRIPDADPAARAAERLTLALETAALEARSTGVPIAFAATPSTYAFLALRPTASGPASVAQSWSEIEAYAERLGSAASAASSTEPNNQMETPVWQRFPGDHPLKSVRLESGVSLAALRVDGAEALLANALGEGTVVRWFGNESPRVEVLVRDAARGSSRAVAVGATR